MKRKYLSVRSVMSTEIRFGRRWLREAQAHLAMAEDNLTEVRRYLAEREAPSEAELELMREAIKLREEASNRVRFYDGVLSGMMLMEKAVLERSTVDSFQPFGPFKR